MTSTKTLAELRTNLYNRLGVNQTSKVYDATFADENINEGIREIISYRSYANETNSYSLNKAADGIITEYSATEINIGTIPTFTPTSGKVMIIDAELVDYASVSTTSFATLTGLDVTYYSGDKLMIGYELPATLEKISEVIFNGRVLTKSDRREFTISKSLLGYYTIIDGFIFLPFSQKAQDVITINYIPTHTDLVLDTDISVIDDRFWELPAMYAAYKMLQLREDDRAIKQEEQFEKKFRKYKAWKSREIDGINNYIPSKNLGNKYF